MCGPEEKMNMPGMITGPGSYMNGSSATTVQSSPASATVQNAVEKRMALRVSGYFTGEFVHPNVIYSMEIDAKVRRLVVGAALGNAG